MKLPTTSDDLLARFAQQRAASRARPMSSPDERREHLHALEELLLRHRDALCTAIAADFGHRPQRETLLLEVFPSIECLRHARKQVAKWMRPESRRVGRWFMPARAEVRYQPLGVVGIIVPWNYPLYLAAGPLAGALAAGNRAMLKLSELTPRFGELFAELVSRQFDRDQVSVHTGGASLGREFSKLPFDHLLFTGSTAVGREIMASAAANLTPVTLELGGKSPALIVEGCDLTSAARRIAFGKLVNAGQTCIAPDYVLTPHAMLEPLVEGLRAAAVSMYRDAESRDYASIVNDAHFARLQALVTDATAHGARIEPLLPHTSATSPRRFPPIAIIGGSPSMRVRREEIFGPLLPIECYGALDEAIDVINTRPRPLALYVFARDRAATERILAHTASGGVTTNDTLLHVAQPDLPFGGVGASGFGRYHGIEGFRAFSQVRGIVHQRRPALTTLMYPPYNSRLKDRLLSLMLRARK